MSFRDHSELAEPVQDAGFITLEQVDDLCADHGFHYEDEATLFMLQDLIGDAIALYGTPRPSPS